MNRAQYYAIAALLGYGGSILGTLLIRGAVIRNGWGAATMEFFAGLMGIAGWRLYETCARDTRIMVAELGGAVLGVRMALWLGW